MKLTAKKLFLFGFLVVLLAGIPATIYLVQQQQEQRSRAAKATILNYSPDSSATAPISKQVGDSIPLDIMVNPGTNLVSFVKLEIDYDPDKLATASAAFQANTAAFPSVLEGPIYSPGKIAVTLSVGPDPTKAIQTLTKAATVTFKAIANTPAGTPTLVTYGTSTQVLSIGSQDQASENVLSSANPATIVIGGSATLSSTPIPIPTASPTDTPIPSATSVPADTGTPTPTFTPTPTATGGASTSTNQSPICNSLSVDRTTTGNAPFSITFTANGTDPDGTVSKVTFNFGDGAVSDVTDAGGVGSNSVNAQIAHTYNNVGTYQASAILTDNNGAVSDSTNCKQTITVNTASGSATTAPVVTFTPTPTMAATGSVSTPIAIGVAAMLFIVGGGFIFFML
jgi:hypothetical protein